MPALAVLLAACLLTGAAAQDAKPWQRQGSRAGETISGPDGGKLVWVPAGEFMMGSDDGEKNETPKHRVRVTRGFWLGKYEVTVAQWLEYSRAAGVALQTKIIAPSNDYPMMGLNFDDVCAYCRFYGLSLPTEAQWEYAARGSEGRQYPWGNEWDESKCCNNENTGPTASIVKVGSIPADVSWCGAMDMGGNLTEWCSDWYARDYYAGSPQDDPTGPPTGTERVQRGGYCFGEAEECRSAYRFSDDPDNRDGAGGLRPCYTP